MPVVTQRGEREQLGADPAPVPVLLYHAVTDDPGRHISPFATGPAEFERHLDAVLASGRRCLTLSELVTERSTGAVDERPPVVITFDDGYADFAAAALPALSARGLASTLYVTTGWLAGRGRTEAGPSDRMLDWSQLPELVAAGVEIGAHSHSHPQMDTLSAAALREELVRPRTELADVLGSPVPSFAYPHGYNGPRVRRAVRAAGYASAAAVRGALSPPGEDRFAVSRLMVAASDTAHDVTRWLEGAGVPVAGRRESAATAGWRAYRRSRTLVRREPGSDYR